MPRYLDEYIKKRNEWWITVNQLVQNADYKKAVKQCKLGIRLFPNDVLVEFRYCAILSDFYLTNTKSKNKANLKRTIVKMSKCIRRTKGLPAWAKNYMKNEYYFQSRQFKEQYELGINDYKKSKDKFDLYSSGVGGANYALELAKKGQKSRAKNWAQKSIEAWEIYFEINSKYYNPYVHYALAWGILGDKKKMMKSLRKSSKLCGKPMSYKEFIEVIDEVEKIHQ